MSATRQIGLKRLATAILAVLMLVPQAAMALEVGVSPVISNYSASPNPYDPQSGTNYGFVTVNYTLNTDAVTTVEILDGTTVIRNLGTATKLAGANSINWDGKNNGSFVAEKTYNYRITATNRWGTTVVTGAITVDYAAQQGTAPVVTNDYASPNPFDPNTQSTTINYTLNTAATVTVSILDGNTVVRTLATSSQNSGANSMSWDGRINGVIAAEKAYTYSIYAQNTYGNTTETGSVTIDYVGQSGTAPVISNDYASPNPFDPNTQTTTINYSLNTTANVTVTILDGSTVIETLSNPGASRSSGSNASTWDGRDSSNNPFAEKAYTYSIYATNSSGSVTRTGSVTVDYVGGGSGSIPNITSHYITPNPFEPCTNNNDARITFNLDKSANVTVEILDNGSLIRTLTSYSSVSSGSHDYYWNGEDDSGDLVDNGTYTYRIKASNSYGTDTEWSTVDVEDCSDDDDDNDFEDDYGNLISDVSVENALFNPEDNERAKLLFDVEEDNVQIDVRIIRESKSTLRALLTNRDYDESSENSVYWNGKDDNSHIVDDDLYLFKLEARKGSEYEVAYRYLEVDTDGHIIGFPDDNGSNGDCGGFSDVSTSNPYCKAVELMKIKGIFTGYSDGTFRPYNPINRAETTKVVLLAIGYSILKNDGTNLGFWDVTKNAWYMPYLRTAKNNGIVRGYPNGAFRPENVPNKVELLKIFLEATNINMPYCNTAPFNDTPVTAETRWYIDYVCFAAGNNLINAEYGNNFNPDAPMNRGDVAMLFYNFYVRGVNSQMSGYNNYDYNGYYNDYNNYYPYTY